jgi:hypothetical protein
MSGIVATGSWPRRRVSAACATKSAWILGAAIRAVG